MGKNRLKNIDFCEKKPCFPGVESNSRIPYYFARLPSKTLEGPRVQDNIFASSVRSFLESSSLRIPGILGPLKSENRRGQDFSGAHRCTRSKKRECVDVLGVRRDNREWIAHGENSIGREGDQSLPGPGEIAHNYTDTQQAAARPRSTYLHPPPTFLSPPIRRTRRSQ